MDSRLLRIIVLSTFVFILGANLVLFTIVQPGTYVHNYVEYAPNFVFMNKYHYNYRGFKDFFDYISTFPGLINSHLTVNRMAAILSREISYTGYTIVDAVLGVFDILSSPVQLIITFILDIFNNVVWIFTFFLPHYFS